MIVVTQSHVKYHLIYQISIKRYRFTYRIDQTDRYAALIFKCIFLNENAWTLIKHDDVTKWKHFPCYWPFVRGIHRSPVNSPRKVQWHGALMFPLICAWINGWVDNHEVGDRRRYHTYYDFSVMISLKLFPKGPISNISSLVQIMAWCCPGDKPLSEPTMVSLPTHICINQPQWIKLMICCLVALSHYENQC